MWFESRQIAKNVFSWESGCYGKRGLLEVVLAEPDKTTVHQLFRKRAI